MNIGIPVERKQGEGRVALTPGAVAELVNVGRIVFVEKGAGLKSGFADELYRMAGAKIVGNQQALYDEASLIVKVKEPLEQELPYLKRNHILFCYLHLAANTHLVQAFHKIKNTAIAYELVEVDGHYPLLAPMSDIAGKVAIQLGMHHLTTVSGGAGILLEGGYGAKRANVVVLGGGVAGFSAAKRAAAIGANVIILDIKTDVLKRANALAPNVTGIYSYKQSIEEAVREADLVVGAVLVPGQRPPVVLPRTLLSQLKEGAVVIDIAIDQGGCVEGIVPTTHDNPSYKQNGVQLLAVTNLPGIVPVSSTQCLSGAILPYVHLIANGAMDESSGLHKAVCIKNGRIM